MLRDGSYELSISVLKLGARSLQALKSGRYSHKIDPKLNMEPMEGRQGWADGMSSLKMDLIHIEFDRRMAS